MDVDVCKTCLLLKAVTVVTLLVFLQGAQGAEYQLQFQDNYRQGTIYRYLAQCSIPCAGEFKPGQFQVTISLDKICSNFDSFGIFNVTQKTESSVWYLNNVYYVSADNAGLCQFVVQFDHETESPVPTGTCKQHWEAPSTCLIPDVNRVTSFGGSTTCFDVVRNIGLSECYNLTIFSQCCQACNDYRLDIESCSFGDLRPASCNNIEDSQCYNTDVENNCCETCHHRKQVRDAIDGCAYGDRDITRCETVDLHECYYMNTTCCESCHWMEDVDYPNCLYGDKRPDFCNTLVLNDCYGSKNASDCCLTCKIEENADPNCMYGDRSDNCMDIDRRECYLDTTAHNCCESCSLMEDPGNPDCAFGDKRFVCAGIPMSECLNNANIERDCCQTCPYLIQNECADDEPTECYTIQSQACYGQSTRQECCYSCLYFYQQNVHLPEDCRYGDRKPNQCSNLSSEQCYDGSTLDDCCESCHYLKRDYLPESCQFGDREGRSCGQLASLDCYWQADQCCETCHYYDQSAALGTDCQYGDRIYDCYSTQDYDCYDINKRSDCCKHCQSIKREDQVGCEYGDQSGKCANIEPMDCYNNEQTCCRTCPLMESPLRLDNCKYGDRRECQGVQASECYDANTNEACCETCHILRNQNTNNCEFGDSAADCGNIQAWECYIRDTDCCETCQKFKITTPGIGNCTYGDHKQSCEGLTSAQECYDADVEYKCCQSCYEMIRTDLPLNCKYGDRLSTCYSANNHPSECYDRTRNEECCEACHSIRTDIPGCLYGDRHVLCDEIPKEPHHCYNNTIYNTCCQSCPAEKIDHPIDGCIFGDHTPDCDVDRCPRYNNNKLYGCCVTCRDYIESLYPTTTDYVPTTTPGGDDGTGKQTGSSIAPIVGGIVGGVILVAIVIIVTCFIMKRRKPSAEKHNGNIRGFSGLESPHRATPAPTFTMLSTSAMQPRQTNTPPHQQQLPSNQPSNQPSNLPNNQPSNLPSNLPSNGVRNPGYKGQPPQNSQKNQPPSNAGNDDYEVYDYIDDSDVRTVVSMPTRRPTLPDRGDGATGYTLPGNEKQTSYDNPSFNKETTDDHPYHVLEKGSAGSEQEMTYHEYMKLQ